LTSPSRGNKLVLYLLLYKLIMNYLFIGAIIVFELQLNLIALIITSQILNFFLPFIAYKIITKQKFSEILDLKPLNVKSVILIICMSIVIQPAMMFVSAISSIFVTNDIAAIMQQLTVFPVFLSIVAIGVAPSLFEELMFRGALHNEYRKVDIKKAALVNGLFFGIMHMNLQQFVYAALLGVLLTYFMHYTGSIFAAMLSHFVINSSQVMLGHFSFQQIAYMEYTMAEPIPEPSMLATLTFLAIFASLLIPLFIFLFREFVDANQGNHIPVNIEDDGVTLKLEKGLSSYKINNWAFKGVVIYFVLYFAIDSFF